MTKFKVGNTVRAKYGNGYGITTNGWEGKVVEVEGRTISLRGGTPDGGMFTYAFLDADKFDLIDKDYDARLI